MKKILHFILLSLLAMEISSQWTIVNSSYPGNLYCLRFQDVNSGYITGSTQGILFRTTDGGNTGISLNTGTTNSFYDVHFFDAQTGFLAGTAGQILMTTDAGTSWTPKTNGSDTLYNIVFPTMNVGYCVGGGSSPSIIYKTMNAGSSWSPVTSPTSNILKGVFFVFEDIGWVCGYNGALYMTTDGGSTWSNQSQSSSYSFEKVFFIDANRGIVVGSSGAVFKTSNGGTNWDLRSSGITEGLYDIGFVGPVFLWSVGAGGKVIFSNDAGDSWVQQGTASSNTFYGVQMVDPNNGFIVASGGMLLKTTNSGGPAIGIINNQVPVKFELKQNYPNPFNPSTQIEYSVLKSGNVKLWIYDITGKYIKTLVNEFQTYGTYRYEFNSTELASGVYFYRIETKDFTETKKMVLMK